MSMRNIYFPTTIIDGFFNDPDAIRKIGLEQEYITEQSQHHPGKRSRKSLQEINELLYQTIITKFLDLFYDRAEVHAVSSVGSFQLVNKKYNSGWVHRDDPTVVTGIIYLSPNENNTPIGTSLYQKNTTLDDPNKYYKNDGKFSDPTNYEEARIAYNSSYRETLNVAGIYNRFLAFDSHYYHAAHKFIGETDEESRMTIVFFIRGVSSFNYPIQKINSNAFTIL